MLEIIISNMNWKAPNTSASPDIIGLLTAIVPIHLAFSVRQGRGFKTIMSFLYFHQDPY